MKKSICIILAFMHLSCFLIDPLSSGEETDKVINIEDPLSFNRDSIEIDDFKINNISINANQLTLNVSYGGGCKEHSFKLYATHGIYFSDPPQADVYLSHNANGDFCEAYITKNIKFDLSPMFPPIYLRIHPFEASEPIYPLILYR
jgi:hypothetical protein